MKSALKIVFSIIFLWMLYVTIRASAHQNVIDAVVELSKNPWAAATLYDAYFGFLTFYFWVFYRESSWASRIFWFLFIMALGNIAMSLYMLIRLFKLKPEEGFTDLLLRKEDKLL